MKAFCQITAALGIIGGLALVYLGAYWLAVASALAALVALIVAIREDSR